MLKRLITILTTAMCSNPPGNRDPVFCFACNRAAEQPKYLGDSTWSSRWKTERNSKASCNCGGCETICSRKLRGRWRWLGRTSCGGYEASRFHNLRSFPCGGCETARFHNLRGYSCGGRGRTRFHNLHSFTYGGCEASRLHNLHSCNCGGCERARYRIVKRPVSQLPRLQLRRL